jgi:formylglycine-generating enzyme required for sulfatase activity
MRRFGGSWFAASCRLGAAMGVVALVIAAQLLRGEPGQDADAGRIAELIQQLGAGEYTARDAASHELARGGERTLRALREAAARSEDAEIRWRAEALVQAIFLHSRSIGLELVLIKPGQFQMGSPFAEMGHQDDEPVHKAQLTQGFLIGKYEVTQDEYLRVMGSNPSAFAAQGSQKERVKRWKTGRFPVELVSWYDTLDFCNRLSELDGYEPYYELSGIIRVAGIIQQADVKIRGGHGYRLPTEAEWEYACRAGTSRPFFFGDENTGREANVKPAIVPGGYGGTPKFADLSRTTEAGCYPPNPWGLFDMHGNVGEWCWDWYERDYYANSPAADPPGPQTGTHRVIRGGSWMVLEGNCRSASRYWQQPHVIKDFVGFRVARTPSR